MMLKIWVNGFRKDCIKDPNSYFNLHKKKIRARRFGERICVLEGEVKLMAATRMSSILKRFWPHKKGEPSFQRPLESVYSVS